LAFTLVEAVFAIGALGMGFVGLYLGIGQCFLEEQVRREDLRAAQILQEKTETIRLYTWSQITNSTFLPSTFCATFYPAGTSDQQGTVYSGTVTVGDPPITEGYSNDFKLVTVQVSWTCANIAHQRQVSTLVSRYGLHNYVYN